MYLIIRWASPIIGLVSWVALLYFSLNSLLPQTPKLSAHKHIAELSMVFFLYSTLLYYRVHMYGMTNAKLTDYVRVVLYSGMVVVFFTIFLEIARFLVENSEMDNKALLKVAIFRVSTGLVLVFLIRTFYVWRSLVLYKSTRPSRRLWRIFEVFILLSVPSIFFRPDLFSPWFLAISILPVGLILFISFNLRWVAYLSTRDKWEVILLFVLVMLVSVYFYQLLQTSIQVPAARISPEDNAFILYLYIFIVCYSAVSLLVTLFNIPTSDIVEQKIRQASSLQELGKNISQSQKEEEIYEVFLESALQVSRAKDGFLEIRDKNKQIKSALLKGIDLYLANHAKDLLMEQEPYQPGVYLMQPDRSQVDDPMLQERGYKSILMIELEAKGNRIGTLGLFHTSTEIPDQENLETTIALGRQAALSIQTFRLERESIYNERYRQELKVARKVQRNLLPKVLDAGNLVDIALYNHTPDEVGGGLL